MPYTISLHCFATLLLTSTIIVLCFSGHESKDRRIQRLAPVYGHSDDRLVRETDTDGHSDVTHVPEIGRNSRNAKTKCKERNEEQVRDATAWMCEQFEQLGQTHVRRDSTDLQEHFLNNSIKILTFEWYTNNKNCSGVNFMYENQVGFFKIDCELME